MHPHPPPAKNPSGTSTFYICILLCSRSSFVFHQILYRSNFVCFVRHVSNRLLCILLSLLPAMSLMPIKFGPIALLRISAVAAVPYVINCTAGLGWILYALLFTICIVIWLIEIHFILKPTPLSFCPLRVSFLSWLRISHTSVLSSIYITITILTPNKIRLLWNETCLQICWCNNVNILRSKLSIAYIFYPLYLWNLNDHFTFKLRHSCLY